MDQKKLNLGCLIAAAFFAVLAIILLVVGIVYDGEHAFTKVLLIIVSLISLALAAELLYLVWISGSGHPNYFLYDSKIKKNISLQKLTFQMVDSRMNRFFAGYASSEGKIWTEGILDNPYLEMAEEFKPLVAYKLLFDIARADNEKAWKCFEISSVSTVDFICRGLEQNGDAELAKNVKMMKMTQPFQLKYIRDYLVNNKGYIQSRMMRYIRENIDRFE